MSAPERLSNLRGLEPEDVSHEWSQPEPGTASDISWDPYRDHSAGVDIPQASLRAAFSASLPTDLNADESNPLWASDGEQERQSPGISPSLNGYLHHGQQSAPRRLAVRLKTDASEFNSAASEMGSQPSSRDGFSDTDIACLKPTTTPGSMSADQAVLNYMSDSQLSPDASVRHKRFTSTSSARLSRLPSLRRGETGRRRPAVLERKRNNVMMQALTRGTVAPGQPSKVWRVRDGKFHQMEWKGPDRIEVQLSICLKML
jgi:hypothetical protein